MARTETHFIWTDDFATRLQELAAAVDAAKNDKTPLLEGEEHPADALLNEYEQLKEEAEAAGLRLTVRGLRDDEWDDLVSEHPPRTDEQFEKGDKTLGFNERTGIRPLLLAGLVEPSFQTRSRLDDWIAEQGLARGDLLALAMRVWKMTNGSGPIDPKLLSPLQARDADPS